MSMLKNNHSGVYVSSQGELEGRVPEELHSLASGEVVLSYIKGAIITALLLGGAAYFKHKANSDVQKNLPSMSIEQQEALKTYSGSGM